MAIKVTIPLDAPDDVLSGYGAGAVLQLQRATDEAFTTPVDVTEIAVVAATYVYESWDAAGDSSTWYRWRAENSADTETGDWSAAFQGVEPALAARNAGSYASLDDLLLAVPQIPTDSRRLARMETALVETTDQLIAEIGYDFFRHPQTGTEARTFHGMGTNLLHVHSGIVSLTAVDIRLSIGASWTSIAAADWWLEVDPGELRGRPGEPYFHVRLSADASYVVFPKLENAVRLTGAFNWNRPPARVVAANVAWARQTLAADPSFPGGIVGPDEFGRPVGPNRLPDAVWRLKLSESRRHQCST